MPYKDRERQLAYWREYSKTRKRTPKPCRRCGGRKRPGDRNICSGCRSEQPHKCEWCGTPFRGWDANPNRFCSVRCKNKWQVATMQNPEGKVHIKASRWGIHKKGGACRSCGATAVHLHHAIPRSKCRALADDLRNGLPLCARCHSRWHAGYPIRREAFTEEEWACLKQAVIPGWEIEAWLEKHYPSAESIRENAIVVA